MQCLTREGSLSVGQAYVTNIGMVKPHCHFGAFPPPLALKPALAFHETLGGLQQPRQFSHITVLLALVVLDRMEQAPVGGLPDPSHSNLTI